MVVIQKRMEMNSGVLKRKFSAELSIQPLEEVDSALKTLNLYPASRDFVNLRFHNCAKTSTIPLILDFTEEPTSSTSRVSCGLSMTQTTCQTFNKYTLNIYQT